MRPWLRGCRARGVVSTDRSLALAARPACGCGGLAAVSRRRRVVEQRAERADSRDHVPYDGCGRGCGGVGLAVWSRLIARWRSLLDQLVVAVCSGRCHDDEGWSSSERSERIVETTCRTTDAAVVAGVSGLRCGLD